MLTKLIIRNKRSLHNQSGKYSPIHLYIKVLFFNSIILAYHKNVLCIYVTK
jgi:hypothetical protein